MLSYGKGIVAVNVIAAIVHHADLVIVGRYIGSEALGLYQVAAKLPDMTIAIFLWATSTVLFPALARLGGDGRALARGYLQAVRHATVVTFPAAIALSLLSRPLVATLFGERWLGAAPILGALALGAAARSLGTNVGDALKAGGRPALLGMLGAARAVVLLPALLLAARSGVEAVAVTQAGVTALSVAFNLAVASRLLDIERRQLLRALWPALLTGGALAATLLVGLLLGQRLLPALPPPAALAALALLGGAAYLATLRLCAPEAIALLRAALVRRAAKA
jgi:O-antigen/teichoic acid export membrane protein